MKSKAKVVVVGGGVVGVSALYHLAKKGLSDVDRPRIVVFEQRPGSKFKVRVLYLQLVMMAGR